MTVVQDTGPAADQLNIAATGVLVNDISITATQAGHGLLLAQVRFENPSATENLDIVLRRNGINITGTNARMNASAANEHATCTTHAALTNIVVGDVFTILAVSSLSTADLLANLSHLILVMA